MVTVVGLGFVGLTTALGFAEYGHTVYGIEVNSERLSLIQSGELPFWEPNLDTVLRKHVGKRFFPTNEWKEPIAQSDVVYYCVGTPYGDDGKADLIYLYNAIEQTLAAIQDDKFRVLVVKSTIPPSTTEKHIIPFLRKKGIHIPEQIGVANNPEFLREGHCWEDFIHADRIVLGVGDTKSEAMLRELYQNASAPVYAVSLNTGEFIKYLSNTSLACLISFANEMSLAADAIGNIDIAQAFRILHMDKRWQDGSIRNYFYPGCGYGGYCLPKDTNAFYAVTKAAGYDGQILKNVIATNNDMPKKTAERIVSIAGNNTKQCIGILGLAFNAGSDDVRDTPSAKIIQELNKAGYENIMAYDPVANDTFKKAYPNLQCKYVEDMDIVLFEANTLAIITAWEEFKEIKKRTVKPIVDCRYMLDLIHDEI